MRLFETFETEQIMNVHWMVILIFPCLVFIGNSAGYSELRETNNALWMSEMLSIFLKAPQHNGLLPCGKFSSLSY